MLRCTFAAALPDWQGVLAFEVEAGATVADVLRSARERVEKISRAAAVHTAWDSGATGIFGLACDRTQPVREGDRIELYLPLSVDPKEARRARAR